MFRQLPEHAAVIGMIWFEATKDSTGAWPVHPRPRRPTLPAPTTRATPSSGLRRARPAAPETSRPLTHHIVVLGDGPALCDRGPVARKDDRVIPGEVRALPSTPGVYRF